MLSPSAREIVRRKPWPSPFYKVIELVGTSTESWEKAAKAAVDRATRSLRDLRIAEVVQQDMQLKDRKVKPIARR
jgi:dodecin